MSPAKEAKNVFEMTGADNSTAGAANVPETTLFELYKAGSKILSESEIAEARLDAWYLLEYVTGVPRAAYFADPDRAVPKEEEAEYLSLIRERAKHIPLQHLTGEQVFMGLTFFVNEDVLVPRQDTEVLCETALAWLKKRAKSAASMQILDLCTGSGCILISLLSLAKEQGICAEGVGADISRAALNVAKKNAERNNVKAEWKQGDLFTNITGRFDLIISNPPYIRTADIKNLAPEVKGHDPRLALDGGADGLFFYRKIIRESPVYIRPGGLLSLEIGMDQGREVSRLMVENGWKNVRVKKDLAGLDRVVTGVYT